MTYASLIEQTLQDIETELKARGSWGEPVAVGSINASIPFPVWLQSVYLPMMRNALASKQLPLSSAMGPVAAKHFEADNQLVNLCLPLTRMDYYVNRRLQALLDGPLVPRGDEADAARLEACTDLAEMAENAPNAVYNVAVMLVVSHGQNLYAGVRNEQIFRALHDAELLCRWVNDHGMETDQNGQRLYHESASIQLGQILYFQKRFDEAEESLLQGMNMNPYNGTWLTCADTLARIYMERTDYDSAIPVLERLVEYHPTYVPGHTKLKSCLDYRAQAEAEKTKNAEVEAVSKVGNRVHQLSMDLQERIRQIMSVHGESQTKVVEIQRLQSEFQENILAAMKAA